MPTLGELSRTPGTNLGGQTYRPPVIDAGGYTAEERAAQTRTDAENKMRQLQVEQQTLSNQRMMQDASAAPGTTRFQGGPVEGLSGGGGGSRSSSSSGSGGGGNNAALDALLREIKNQQVPTVKATPYTPTQMPTQLDPRSQAATYGAAKERTGLAMQAAMRGLRANMASRGITGTGLDAEAQTNVYESGLGDLASTDRAQATADADRIWSAQQANTSSANQAGQFNSTQDLAAQQANADAAARRSSMLIQLASLY